MKKTLEEYLKESVKADAIDHTMRASVDGEGKVTFYIHPQGKDGDTQDYEVKGNALTNVVNNCFECGTEIIDNKCSYCYSPSLPTNKGI